MLLLHDVVVDIASSGSAFPGGIPPSVRATSSIPPDYDFAVAEYYPDKVMNLISKGKNSLFQACVWKRGTLQVNPAMEQPACQSG